MAAQSGDRTAIAALVSGAHPHVRRFAFSLCASNQDAEDAAQEAMIVLLCKIGTLRAASSLAAWMFRIVRNECLRRVQASVLSGEPAVEMVARSAEDEMLSKLEIDRVVGAIASLPAEQRRVLLMRDVQGLSGNAVAKSVGLSTAAMKSRLHRARTAVRAELETWDERPLG